MEEFYWAALGVAKGLERRCLQRLVRFFGSARALYEAGEDALLAAGLSPARTELFLRGRAAQKNLPEQLAERCTKLGIRVIPLNSGNYPERLKHILCPPAALYVKGCLPDCRYSIAMAGARQAEAYGLRAARYFAGALAKAGVVVVSGGARGIDTESHEGTLQAGGKTIAVLGCGVDIAYPSFNRPLFARIAEQGAVISEYMPGTPPRRYHFPARNRIISGICQGLLLIQAAEKSGALITAEFAQDEGRELFCIPGSIFSEKSAGPHRLIKAGAKLADSPQDILAEVFPELQGKACSNLFSCGREPQPEQQTVSPEGSKLLDLLTEGPQTLEMLLQATGWTVQQISVYLLELQLKGCVQTDAAQRYVRV